MLRPTQFVSLLALCATGAFAADLPGQRPDGSVLLPNQWVLRPVGTQIPVGDFPVQIAMHPGGKFAAILHCGYSAHEVVILDLHKNAIASRSKLAEAFYGITFSPDGTHLFCSGSSGETIHSFGFADGELTEPTTIPLRDAKKRGIPAGLAATADGKTLYVANLWGQSISRVRLAGSEPEIAELALTDTPPEPAPVITPTTDDPSITKRDEALLEKADPSAPFPYACVLDEKRERLYVSLWAQASVAVIDLKTFTVASRWTAEDHPNEMLLSKDGRHLYVANANRNTVSVLDTTDGHSIETLLAELQPSAPPGNTPNSVALSPNGDHLFVANANINTVAVFDVSSPGKSRSLGFIPVGWYPTSVRVTKDGKTLLVANGKGETSKPNPDGPKPGHKTTPGAHQYIGELLNGTISVIPLPSGEKFEPQLKAWTAQAYSCTPATESKLSPEALAGNAVPRQKSDATPLKYVFYIIKENRTYDQMLGDMKEGNGDPSICLFPEAVTPNHHALAREFVLLDNLYVDAEVSADGHEWTMGAYASDFVEKSWPLSYGHNKSGKFPYPSEGNFPIATPAGGYLWDRARQAGISYRSYGEWVANPKKLGEPGRAKTKAIEGHFVDPFYRSFDTAYSDQNRADRFLEELKRFESEGEMPRSSRSSACSNDHTSGTSPGKPTPTAQCVATTTISPSAVSSRASGHSRFWPQTAIFVGSRTMRRMARIMSMPTARSAMRSAPTSAGMPWIPPCIPRAACCTRSNSSSGWRR